MLGAPEMSRPSSSEEKVRSHSSFTISCMLCNTHSHSHSHTLTDSRTATQHSPTHCLSNSLRLSLILSLFLSPFLSPFLSHPATKALLCCCSCVLSLYFV